MKFQLETEIILKYKIHYLQSIADNASQVLRDLEKIVPLYEKVFKTSRWDQTDVFFNQNNLPKKLVTSEQRKEFALRHSFNKWVNDYSLDKIWIKRAAFYTLHYWQNPRTDRNRFIGAFDGGFMEDMGEPLTIEIDGWCFTSEDSDDFIKNSKAAFEKALDKYMRETKNKAELEGYKREHSRDFENLKWLIDWNIEQLTKKEIADKYNTVKDTIEKSFRKYKNFDLPVREGRRKRITIQS